MSNITYKWAPRPPEAPLGGHTTLLELGTYAKLHHDSMNMEHDAEGRHSVRTPVLLANLYLNTLTNSLQVVRSTGPFQWAVAGGVLQASFRVPPLYGKTVIPVVTFYSAADAGTVEKRLAMVDVVLTEDEEVAQVTVRFTGVDGTIVPSVFYVTLGFFATVTVPNLSVVPPTFDYNKNLSATSVLALEDLHWKQYGRFTNGHLDTGQHRDPRLAVGSGVAYYNGVSWSLLESTGIVDTITELTPSSFVDVSFNQPMALTENGLHMYALATAYGQGGVSYSPNAYGTSCRFHTYNPIGTSMPVAFAFEIYGEVL